MTCNNKNIDVEKWPIYGQLPYKNSVTLCTNGGICNIVIIYQIHNT